MFKRKHVKTLTVMFGLLTSINSWAQSHNPQAFLHSIAGSKDEGMQIVQHYCASCHAVKPMIPVGAPRMGEVKDWTLRAKPGLRILLQHADEGLNAMPARGGCFECSDKQLMLAVMAMLPQELKTDLK